MLAGAPISTFDLDIVPARSPESEGYDQLLADVVERQISGHNIRTLGLASLIRTTEAAGRSETSLAQSPGPDPDVTGEMEP